MIDIVSIRFQSFRKQCDFSPAGSGHIELQVFLSCEVPPLNGVIETVFGWISQLVQLNVIVNECVSQQPKHEQHEWLGSAVYYSTQTPKNHHQDFMACGKAELG